SGLPYHHGNDRRQPGTGGSAPRSVWQECAHRNRYGEARDRPRAGRRVSAQSGKSRETRLGRELTHMDKFLIRGGSPPRGELPASGSKNSALPALAACLLTREPVILHRVPQVRDIATMIALLQHTGAIVDMGAGGPVRVTAGEITRPEAPYDVVKT